MIPKYRLIVLSTLVIITIAAYLFYRSQTSAELTLYGNVDVRTVHLSFRVGGQLKELYVDEGDTVTKGQLLASLDNEPYLYAQERAKGVQASAFARLNMMENGYRQEEIAQIASEVNQRKAALEYAQSFYRRQQTLSKQRATSLNELEEAKNYLNQADAALTASQDKLRLYQSGFRSEEIDAAKGEWHQAEASLQQAELDIKDTELIAPSHGTILTRTVEPGTIVNAGQTIFTLTLTDPVWVRAYISETNLGRAIPGSELLFYTDSQPNKPYHGTIGFVSPTAEFTPKNVETPELRSNLVYRLRIIVTDADDALRQGMPVTIRWP